MSQRINKKVLEAFKQGFDKKVLEGFKQSFVLLCLEALQLGYEKMFLDKQYDLSWQEDKLTAHLVEKIKATGFLNSRQISVNHQSPIYDEGVIYGEDDPLNSPRVDFKFTKWFYENEIEYYSEAKNLSEKDWEKPGGAKVNASKYRGRYIDTGIENFLSERYPEGCLIGYVVQGELSKIIEGINELINKRALPPRVGLINKNEELSLSTCYFSENLCGDKKVIIHHLIMQL